MSGILGPASQEDTKYGALHRFPCLETTLVVKTTRGTCDLGTVVHPGDKLNGSQEISCFSGALIVACRDVDSPLNFKGILSHRLHVKNRID